MISFSVLFGIIILLVLLCIFVGYMFFVKFSVEFGEFQGQKVLYRAVNGNLKEVNAQQTTYMRRAHSLWGKEMVSWPTFRIIYPKLKSKYAIFGFFVPNDFTCDKECLEELGFVHSNLDSIKTIAKIEIPIRCRFAVKINQYRARKRLNSIIKEIAHEQKAFKKQHQSQKNSLNTDSNIEKVDSHPESLNDDQSDSFSTSDLEIDQEFNSDDGENNNNSPENDVNSEVTINNQSETTETITPVYNFSVESSMINGPFCEIRYKKRKKRQLFFKPLIKSNELTGLWHPNYIEKDHHQKYD